MNIIFFGSTSDSVIVLEKLPSVSAIVTQAPKPVGRKQVITPTPVEVWGKEHNIPVLSFPTNPDKPWLYANEQQVIDTIQPIKPDLLVSASYGIMIPWETIEKTPYGGINIHPSILPHWRGADPVPWAILSGDHQIGVSVTTLSKTFDEGNLLAQIKIPILPSDTSDPLRTKLFTLGAEKLIEILPDFTKNKLHITQIKYEKKLPYARKFKREDGFEPWPFDPKSIAHIERKYRALHPWPGLWTTYNGKRLKILALHIDHDALVFDTVQFEGKNPITNFSP